MTGEVRMYMCGRPNVGHAYRELLRVEYIACTSPSYNDPFFSHLRDAER